MKRTMFFGLLLGFLVLPPFGFAADSAPASNSAPATTSGFNFKVDVNELTKQLIDALKPVADKLGQGAEHVYMIAVKDAYVTGLASSAYCLIATILFFTCAYFIIRWSKAGNAEDWDHSTEGYGIGIFIASCIGFICFWVACSYLSDALHYTINPEYMALKDMLAAVKQGGH